MKGLMEALEGAGDGAFIIDEELKFIYWNSSAEEMLGYRPDEVVGALCYRVLRGSDEHQRLVCFGHCRIARQAFRGEPVSNYDIQMQTRSGEKRWLNMSVFTYLEENTGDDRFVVHMFRDIDQKKEDERFFRRLMEAARRYHEVPSERDDERKPLQSFEQLTPREREVLALLARGHSTRDMAQSLSISPNTVRNHIHHILGKLQVHSRLEAVALAIKHDLLE